MSTPSAPAVFVRCSLVFLLALTGCGNDDDTDALACGDPTNGCTLGEYASATGFFAGGNSGDRPEGSSVLINPSYAEALLEHFNAMTVENALKWGPLSPAPGVYNFDQPDALVDFAQTNRIRLRGHVLVWGRLNGPPDWLIEGVDNASDPAAYLRGAIEDHIATTVGRYRGRIPTWDVVNEPLSLVGAELDPDSVFTQVLGAEYIDVAFRAARRADPEAVLTLNETIIINNDVKFDGLIELVRSLLSQGTPIDTIGLQGQFIAGPPPSRAKVRERLQAIEELGLNVEITELSIPINYYQDDADPYAAQAAAFADVYGACLDVPACTGVTTWGVYDAETWIDGFLPQLAPARPLLLDESYGRKPAYDAVLALFATDSEQP